MRKTSAEKRENIIKAASTLFLQRGMDATSMDDIATAAEVSKQTLYSHFGSKEGLFVEAIRDKCLMNNLSDNFFEQPLPAEALLLAYARSFIKLLQTEEVVQMQRTCIAQAQQHADVSQLFYESGPQRLMDALQQYLARLHEGGELLIPDSRAATWQLTFMLRGDAIFRHMLGVRQVLDSQELDDYLRNCVAMFLRAYAPHE